MALKFEKKITEIEEIIAPQQSAAIADLLHVCDTAPGITRKRKGKTFYYLDEDGNKIIDPEILKRIKTLIIPPAWTDVWICSDEKGHIQATGRDAKGRKQYRYHSRWSKFRNELKFDKMILFGKMLPKIREKVEADLTLKGLVREKVIAMVVRLLEQTMIRIGNEEYASVNHSFGLTTMRNKHVRVDKSKIEFSFRGKSGRYHVIKVKDPKISRLVKKCRDLPGHELFEYLDTDGNVHSLSSGDINNYLYNITEHCFTAKDFRTWGGTLCMIKNLLNYQPFQTKAEAKQNIVCAVKAVAKRLGNTPATCKKYYIHPAITELYLKGELYERYEKIRVKPVEGLDEEELKLINLLENVNGK